jgi:hypothetical protein
VVRVAVAVHELAAVLAGKIFNLSLEISCCHVL